jgi:hypothetical protein
MIPEQIFNLTHAQKLFNILKGFNQEYAMEQETHEQSITNLIRSINKLYIINENIHACKNVIRTQLSPEFNVKDISNNKYHYPHLNCNKIYHAI